MGAGFSGQGKERERERDICTALWELFEPSSDTERENPIRAAAHSCSNNNENLYDTHINTHKNQLCIFSCL